MKMRPAALVATGVFVAGLVSVIGASAAHASTTCSYDGSTDTMTVAMPDAALSSTISRTGIALTVNSVVCGNAKVGNTDSIVVNGAAGAQTLEINLANGPIGPGTSTEADTAEIEITPHLGDGTDRLFITGGPLADNIRLGSQGINLNGDTDRDLTLDGVDTVAISGGDNNDTLSAAGGLGTGAKWSRPVQIHGQVGDDTVTGGTGRDVLFGEAGDDVIAGDVGDDYLYGGDDDDTLTGGSGGDTLTGDAGVDSLDGGSGNDNLNEANASNGGDTLMGGTGSDFASYYYRTNAVSVSLDNVANDGETGETDNVKSDVENISGSSTAANTLVGSAAANYLYGGSDTDSLTGGGGRDVIYGYGGADALKGGNDDDTVFGGEGPDTVDGGNDDDTLYGENGIDSVIGGEGDDSIYEDLAPNGADDISGGSGVDNITYSSRTGDLTVTLDNNADDGELGEGDIVHPDIEVVTGSQGKNKLIGSAVDNILAAPYGSSSNDVINGGAGADFIYGYGGNDTLTGGDGEDALYGGDGNDSFKLQDGGYDYAQGDDGADVVVNQDPIDNLISIP